MRKTAFATLEALVNKFTEYNQTESKDTNPFNIAVAEEIQKELIEFQTDRHCKDAFKSVSFEEVWWKKAISSYSSRICVTVYSPQRIYVNKGFAYN